MTEPVPTSMPNLEPYYSVLRGFATFAAGSAVGFGVFSVADANAVVDNVGHIINGSKEIAIGIGGLVGPAMIAWGWAAHQPKAIMTAAASLSVPEREEAFRGIPDTAKVAVAAAIPDVQKIVVSDTAASGLAAMVADPGRPKVVAA